MKSSDCYDDKLSRIEFILRLAKYVHSRAREFQGCWSDLMFLMVSPMRYIISRVASDNLLDTNVTSIKIYRCFVRWGVAVYRYTLSYEDSWIKKRYFLQALKA